jgi:hypothetical protein
MPLPSLSSFSFFSCLAASRTSDVFDPQAAHSDALKNLKLPKKPVMFSDASTDAFIVIENPSVLSVIDREALRG